MTLTSNEKPSEATFTVPFRAGVAVNTLNPKTCLWSGKFPVPGPECVQVAMVPPPDTAGTHRRLSASSPGGKSVEVGAVALTTPASPERVIVATSPGEGQTA